MYSPESGEVVLIKTESINPHEEIFHSQMIPSEVLRKVREDEQNAGTFYIFVVLSLGIIAMIGISAYIVARRRRFNKPTFDREFHRMYSASSIIV
jgi:predicted permease